MIRIFYTEYFHKFLEKFEPDKRQLIKDLIEKYCDHAVLLPRPKRSGVHRDIEKVAIPEVNVVIFYLNGTDTWLILTGVEMFERAA